MKKRAVDVDTSLAGPGHARLPSKDAPRLLGQIDGSGGGERDPRNRKAMAAFGVSDCPNETTYPPAGYICVVPETGRSVLRAAQLCFVNYKLVEIFGGRLHT
jgi:hypothetical protein